MCIRDRSCAYDKGLRNKARLIALENNINLREGVYVGVQGPTFETPAEYKMFRLFGADIVGMSTAVSYTHLDVYKRQGLCISWGKHRSGI